jgi:hypothetical protein
LLPPLEPGELVESTIVGLLLPPLGVGEPLELSEPLEIGEFLEPLFIAKTAPPTMAAMITPPTRSMVGLTVVLAGATWAIAGGIGQAGGIAATGAGGGGAGIAAGAWAAAGTGPMAGTVAPHEAQNLCPGTVIAVPQLGQKPNPVAISISLRLAGAWR